jgi:signal transduction histidine kinase
MLMSSTETARRLLVTRPIPGWILDIALTWVALSGTLAMLAHGGVAPSRPGSEGLDPTGFLLVVASAVPLLVWRRFPLGAFAVTAVAGVLLGGLGYPVDLLIGPAFAVYLLAASREPGAPWTTATTATVVGLLLAYLGATTAAHGTLPSIELLHTGMAWGAAWFAGERTRLRRQHVADLRDRARRVEREAEQERLLAVAEERTRIARDLHDSAGHAINVIAVQAGAARLRHGEEPERALRALEAIEQLARQTVGEIDEMVGTLREDASVSGGVEAPVGLASVDTLIANHFAAGLEVTFDASGTPRPLGPTADQAVYRILQEALTNAARHGTGSVRVELDFTDNGVELSVTNPVSDGAQRRSVGGHGLVGMRERATLLGGSLKAGRADGAFHVRARIPYGGHPA